MFSMHQCAVSSKRKKKFSRFEFSFEENGLFFLKKFCGLFNCTLFGASDLDVHNVPSNKKKFFKYLRCSLCNKKSLLVRVNSTIIYRNDLCFKFYLVTIAFYQTLLLSNLFPHNFFYA
jgi:hypothetical protein